MCVRNAREILRMTVLALNLGNFNFCWTIRYQRSETGRASELTNHRLDVLHDITRHIYETFSLYALSREGIKMHHFLFLLSRYCQ